MPENKPSTVRQKLTRAVDRLADPEDATEVLGEVDTTQPLDQRDRRTAVVVARHNAAAELVADAERGVKVARNAEHQRFADAYNNETRHVGDLIALLIEVGDHHSARDLAPAGLRKRVADAARAFTEGGDGP